MIAEIASLFGSRFASRRGRTSVRRRPAGRAMAIELLENRLALAIMVDVVDNTNLGTAGSIFVTGHGIPGNAPAGSTPQELRVVGASGGFVQGAVTITNASCTGTTAKIVTSVAHQLKLNDPVYVSGVGVLGYNGVFTVTGVEPSTSPKWFEYTVPSALASSLGGAAYLPPLLSSQTITQAAALNGLVTLTLQTTANVPLNSAVFISGLSGAGANWNGTGEVTQNSSTNPALTSKQFQINVPSASGTATVTSASVRIVSVNPIALTALPGWNAQTKTGKVTLDQNIKGFSAQLVQMVTPAGAAPYPLGITPGTVNLTSLSIPPFAVGQQAGTSVADFLEFYYAGNTGYSTFDLSGVDGFVLPQTLHASSVTTGPQTVGLNTTLANLSREQIGTAFKEFIGNEPVDVRMTGQFRRLLYHKSVSTNPLTVATASQTGVALTGVSLQPDKDPNSASTFMASISGSTLNVTTNANKLAVNKIITGTGVSPNTYITKINQIKSDGSGTFTVNQSQTVASTSMTGYNATGVITAAKAANGLVPGQSITVSAPGSAYDGQKYTVTLTPLNDNSLSPGQFTFVVPTETAPDAVGSATVTPTSSGVIASGTGTLVVTVTSGPLPAAGSTVQLSGVPNGTFSASVNGPYTFQNPPPGSGLPANAVYLATTTGQTFNLGNSTGGGTLSTPVFVAPPSVPFNQFYAITAPKDWLANQPVATANVDPMVTWWNSTISNFFKAGNYLNVSIGTYVPPSTPQVSITGIRNSGNQTIFTATNSYAVGDVVTIAGFTTISGYNQTARIVAASGTSFSIAGTNTPPVTIPAGAIAQKNRAISYTGTYGSTGSTGSTGFSFVPDQTNYPNNSTPAGNFDIRFSVDKPTPLNVFPNTPSTQSQSLANATWAWAQGNIPATPAGTVQDQIVMAFCRGVALDGVLTAPPTSAGQSNAAWTTITKWYTEHMTPAGINSVYCPFSKFLHFGTLSGGTDFTGTTSIYTGGLAYGFSEDEIPAAADGLPGTAVGGPSKMDGTVADGATMTLIVNPWNGGTPQAPHVTSIDTIPPQSPPGTPTPTTATTLSWTVSFSEPVKGVTLDDFISTIVSGPLALDLKGVTANSGTALSQTWTVTGDVLGTGTGVIGTTLTKAGSITDASGTSLTLPATFPGQTYRVTPNPVGPTATIVIAGTNPTNAATVPFTVTFSQAVTGLAPTNFTIVPGGGVTGSFVQGFSGSGTTYTVTVNTGSGSGKLKLKLASAPGGSIVPAPTGLPVTSAAYKINKNEPTKAPEVQGITLAGTNPTNAASVSWTVTFTEPVTGVTKANFAIVNGGLGGTPTITGVTPASNSNTATWKVTASTGSGSGTLGLKMANSTNVHDANLQPVTNVPFTGLVYTVDRTTPAARSIVRANASPTSLSVVSWTVTFSEVIAGLSHMNFQLAATGLKGAQVTIVAPVGGSAPAAVWTVTAQTGNGNGTLRLDLVNATDITDAVNLAPTGIPLTGQTYTVSRGGATNVDVPIAFMTTMGTATKLRWLMNPFTDRDSVQLSATLSASPGAAAGTFRAASGVGVTVTPSGTAASELTFTGTVANLNAYFRSAAGFITYTPAGSSLTPRKLSLSAQGSDSLSGIATAALLVRAAAAQNPAPAINPVASLTGTAGQPLVITYDQLVTATGATQTTSRSIQFMLAGLNSGRLEVWTGSGWSVVPSQVKSMPLVAPFGKIRWTPPAGASGAKAAFSVKTWDGWNFSGVSQVSVNLTQ